MGFYITDQNNNRSYIDASILKNRLINLASSDYDETDDETTLDESENELLNIFISKISVNIREIGIDDINILIENIVESETDASLLASIFSMERVHFLAIVYLLYQGLINIKDIKELLQMNFLNRTEMLLGFISKESNKDIDLFKNLYLSFEKISSQKSNLSITLDSYSIKETYLSPITLTNFRYNIYKILFKKKGLNLFSRTTWTNISNDPLKPLLEAILNSPSSIRTFRDTYIDNISLGYTDPLYQSATPTTYQSSTLVSEDLTSRLERDITYEDIPSSLEYITFVFNQFEDAIYEASEFSSLDLSTSRYISLRDFFKYFFNNGMTDISRMKLISNYTLKEYNRSYARNAISYAFTNPKPYLYNFFNYMKFIYNNLELSGGEFLAENAILSANSISLLETEDANETDNNSLFPYTDSITKKFYQKLFPTATSETDFSSYLADYLVEVSSNGFATSFSGVARLFKTEQATFADALISNNFEISADRKITTTYIKNFGKFFKIFNSVLTQDAFKDLSSYDSLSTMSFTEVSEMLTLYIAAVKERILSSISLTNPAFIIEAEYIYQILDIYRDFLLDPSQTEFEVQLPTDSILIKEHRLMMFLKNMFSTIVDIEDYLSYGKELGALRLILNHSKPQLNDYSVFTQPYFPDSIEEYMNTYAITPASILTNIADLSK